MWLTLILDWIMNVHGDIMLRGREDLENRKERRAK